VVPDADLLVAVGVAADSPPRRPLFADAVNLRQLKLMVKIIFEENLNLGM